MREFSTRGPNGWKTTLIQIAPKFSSPACPLFILSNAQTLIQHFLRHTKQPMHYQLKAFYDLPMYDFVGVRLGTIQME